MAVKQLARILIFLISVTLAVSVSLLKRDVGTSYSTEDQAALLKAHNDYRSNVLPTASNMIEMKWDADLAKQAQDWANTCVFEHPDNTVHKDYVGIGQNLYTVYNNYGYETPEPAVTEAVEEWHKEDQNYNYEYNACAKGKVCGHYTQIVWADTTAVGCGINYCLSAKYGGNTLSNAWIVACNYRPGGNYIGQWPYKHLDDGQCSQCSDEKPCKNGLCSDCDLNEADCECKINCQNGGTASGGQTCGCTCPKEYYGPFCDEYCENKHVYCAGNPGWPISWCEHDDKPYVRQNCPLMCGLCGQEEDPNK